MIANYDGLLLGQLPGTIRALEYEKEQAALAAVGGEAPGLYFDLGKAISETTSYTNGFTKEGERYISLYRAAKSTYLYMINNNIPFPDDFIKRINQEKFINDTAYRQSVYNQGLKVRQAIYMPVEFETITHDEAEERIIKYDIAAGLIRPPEPALTFEEVSPLTMPIEEAVLSEIEEKEAILEYYRLKAKGIEPGEPPPGIEPEKKPVEIKEYLMPVITGVGAFTAISRLL